jgi:hypothetical protein
MTVGVLCCQVLEKEVKSLVHTLSGRFHLEVGTLALLEEALRKVLAFDHSFTPSTF